MIMHSDKKIICVKDIPSNIIDEAIFILKENVLENADEEYEERSKEIILTEAEDIVEEYMNKISSTEEEEYEEVTTPIDIKKEMLYISFLFTILGICLATVI